MWENFIPQMRKEYLREFLPRIKSIFEDDFRDESMIKRQNLESYAIS